MDRIAFIKGLTEFSPLFLELFPDTFDIGPVESDFGRFLLKLVGSQK